LKRRVQLGACRKAQDETETNEIISQSISIFFSQHILFIVPNQNNKKRCVKKDALIFVLLYTLSINTHLLLDSTLTTSTVDYPFLANPFGRFLGDMNYPPEMPSATPALPLPILTKNSDAWKWIVLSWALFKKEPGAILLGHAIVLISSLAIGLIPGLGSLAGILLSPVFAGGLMLYWRKLANGESTQPGDVFLGFKAHFEKLLLCGVLHIGVLLAAGVIISVTAFLLVGLGFLLGLRTDAFSQLDHLTTLLKIALLGTPFILVSLLCILGVAMSTWYTPGLIVFYQVPPLEALKLSFRTVWLNRWPLTFYGFHVTWLALASLLTLGLLWIILFPVFSGAQMFSYEDLFKKPEATT
jgi:hypothetical protein